MRVHMSFSRVIPLLLLFTLFLAACNDTSTTQSPTPTTAAPTPTPTVALDAYGTPITFPTGAPQRIVSLTPSTSEQLGALNLASRVVAVDYYTNYPSNLASLPKISDASLKYDIEKIISLHPDLILTYGQETKTTDAQLKSAGLRVVALPLANFSQALQEIRLVGRLTGTQGAADQLYSQLMRQTSQIESVVKGTTSPTSFIEEDYSTPGKPYVAGGGSFGDELLQDANGTNIFHSQQGDVQVTDESIISANPQDIIVTEPPQYGGGAAAVYKRTTWANIDAVKSKHVYYVNADIISRPGPRLVEALQCVAQMLHRDKFSGALPAYCS